MLNFREKRSITGTNNVDMQADENVYNDVENVDK